MTEQPADEYRAELDFEISLADGGTLRGRDFRIDVDHAGVTEEALAAALARELGLSAADQVDIHSRQVMRGRHRGSPAAVHRLPPPPDPEPELEPLPGLSPLPGMPASGDGRAAAPPPLAAAASWPPIPAVPADSWPPLPPVAERAGRRRRRDQPDRPGQGQPRKRPPGRRARAARQWLPGLGPPWHSGPQHSGPQHSGPQHSGPQHSGPESRRPGRPRRPPRASGCAARTSATSSRTG